MTGSDWHHDQPHDQTHDQPHEQLHDWPHDLPHNWTPDEDPDHDEDYDYDHEENVNSKLWCQGSFALLRCFFSFRKWTTDVWTWFYTSHLKIWIIGSLILVHFWSKLGPNGSISWTIVYMPNAQCAHCTVVCPKMLCIRYIQGDNRIPMKIDRNGGIRAKKLQGDNWEEKSQI